MRKTVMMFLLVMSSLSAQPGRGFEIGLIAGIPTGLSLKQWFNSFSALDAAVAWSFLDRDFVYLQADYLINNNTFMIIPNGEMPLYTGLGGIAKVGGGDTHAGVRIPIGASYLFGNVPVALFLEAGPIIELVPETAADVNGGVGIRFRF